MSDADRGNSMSDMEYVMACVECGINRAWPEYLCEGCAVQMGQSLNISVNIDSLNLSGSSSLACAHKP